MVTGIPPQAALELAEDPAWSRYFDGWGAVHDDAFMHPIDVAAWPVKIDHRRQLFVDDYLIAERQGVRRQLHQPEKHPANPVLVPEHAWEHPALVLAYCLRDEHTGSFRLWYRSRTTYEENGRTHNWPNLYAESSDGIHWERPQLGLYDWEGSKDNNIILPAGDLRGLIHEPQDEQAPWKAVWEHNSPARSPEWITEEGYYLYTSQDGIRWEVAGPMIPYGQRSQLGGELSLPLSRLGDTGHVRWDPELQTYVCDAKGTLRRDIQGSGHRFRLQLESDDLFHWSRPRVVAFPDRDDLAQGTLGFYGLLGVPYESLWLGFLRVHREEPWKRVDVQLMTSRDGRTWGRACDRETFLPLGPEDSWEPDYSEINHQGPLLVDDQLWFFYRGSTMLGHRQRGSGKESPMAMGLATLRRDGFASMVGDEAPGQITTRPLTFSGRQLHVNAAVGAGGSLRVAVLDQQGQPLSDFTAEHCRPVTGDGTTQPVNWDAGDLGTASRQQVRLRFHLQSAHLYSFWIE
ncbi:MAG: hypothetical protein CL878_01815 [Dehalococcoidia bacterium]|nr:hypothetical protein [Dehalococcoidia bacterium]